MKNVYPDKPYENIESDETRMNLISLPSLIKRKKEMGWFNNEYKVGYISTHSLNMIYNKPSINFILSSLIVEINDWYWWH